MLRQVIRRPVSVLVGSLALVVIGLFSLLRLPVSLLPSLERPRLTVVAVDRDRSREDLLYRVVEPLERRLLSLPGALALHSTVEDGSARLVLDTEWQTDVDRLRIDAERRLDEVAGVGLEELRVGVETGERAPIVGVAVLGGSSAHLRTSFADKTLVPELSRLPGAGRVRRVGGGLLHPVVRPYGAELLARGLSPEDVVSRLRGLGQAEPAGRLRDGAHARPLVVRESVGSLSELARLAIRAPSGATGPAGLDGHQVPLRDVAAVALEEVPDEGLYRRNGEEGVLVEVFRAPGANAVLLARGVAERIESLAERAPAELRLEVVQDASREVVAALSQLGLAALLGLLLGTTVMRLLLGSWRPTLVLATAVPASVIATFGAFFAWGVSLDVVSLAGLALAIGMLVDNAIVVLESIAASRDRDPVVAGSEQIALALVASFLTTAVVFLPLLYLRGLARAFFGVQAFAIVTSLGISLGLSLTLTPVLARLLRQRGSTVPGRQPGRETYLRLLRAVLRHPGKVAGAALLAAGGVAVAGGLALPQELVPPGRVRGVSVQFRTGPGLDHEAAHERARALEQAVLELAEPATGERPSRIETELIYRPHDPESEEGRVQRLPGRLEVRGEDLLRRLPGALHEVAGVETRPVPRRAAFAAALERAAGEWEVEVSAATPEQAAGLAERTAGALAELGLQAVPGTDRQAIPSWVLHWDPIRLADLDAGQGRGLETLEAQVRAGLGGLFAGQAEIASAEPEIYVAPTEPRAPHLLPLRLDAVDPASRTSRPSGVSLAALARVEEELRPPPLERRDARPAHRLLLEGNRGSLRPARLEGALSGLDLAADERVRLAGQGYELRRAFRQLGLALLLAVLLVFLTIAALYESLSLPLVVMATVPVAAAGAVVLLALSAQSLNVMSLLGMVLLTGIVVNNAIVLVHRIEQRRRQGVEGEVRERTAAVEAILDAARDRYRPILMTSLTTLVGMLPLALLGGEGIELRRALAVSVSGGLLTALLASLLVVPALYLLMVGGEGRRVGR